MKKTLTAAAAGALLLGAAPLWMAHAYTPAAEAACADDACSVTLPDEMFIAGGEVVADFEIAGGSTVDLAVWAVTEGDSDDVLEQGPLTLGRQLAGPQTATGPLGSVTFTMPSDIVGTAFIVGPADLDDASIDDAIPAVPGGSRISVRDLRSAWGADNGFTAGMDAFTLHTTGSLDVADLDNTSRNVFMTNVQFGRTGDVYGVEANFGGTWTNITETGETAGGDLDALRTVGANGSADVMWKVPAGTRPGNYQVRLVNETENLTSATVRDFVITGEVAAPTPAPTPSPTTTPTPTATTPATTPTPAAPTTPATPETTPATAEVHYENCADVASRNGYQLSLHEPGYRIGLDRDGDGYACDDLPRRVIGVPSTGH